MTYGTTMMKKKQSRESQGSIPLYTKREERTSTLFGHAVEEIDNRTIFRALFQNPNGINPYPGNYSFQLSLQECYDNCISLIGLVETNRAWEKPDQQRQLKEKRNSKTIISRGAQ